MAAEEEDLAREEPAQARIFYMLRGLVGGAAAERRQGCGCCELRKLLAQAKQDYNQLLSVMNARVNSAVEAKLNERVSTYDITNEMKTWIQAASVDSTEPPGLNLKHAAWILEIQGRSLSIRPRSILPVLPVLRLRENPFDVDASLTHVTRAGDSVTLSWKVTGEKI